MRSQVWIVVVLGAGVLHSEDPLGPKGVNIQLARKNGLTGKGNASTGRMSVAVFEHSFGSSKKIGIKAGHHLADRLIGQWNFSGLTPIVMPLVGEAPPTGGLCPPPATLTMLDRNSDHATDVANILAGAGELGIAPDAYVFATHFSVGDTDDNSKDVGSGSPALNEVRAAIDWLTRNHADSNLDGKPDKPDIQPGVPKVWNFSWGYPNGGTQANPMTQFTDWFAWRFNGETLFVVAAGNEGAKSEIIKEPADLFNGITVGATDNTLIRRAKRSSYRLPIDALGGGNDRRGKPDILAPGQHGTSFAAPRVAATALLLKDNGFPVCCQFLYAWKAILLNSARKRKITGENQVNAESFDHESTGKQESDFDYLLPPGGRKDKTAAWTPSNWRYNGAVFETDSPLDDEQGTGLLDISRAILQMGGSGNLTSTCMLLKLCVAKHQNGWLDRRVRRLLNPILNPRFARVLLGSVELH